MEIPKFDNFDWLMLLISIWGFVLRHRLGQIKSLLEDYLYEDNEE